MFSCNEEVGGQLVLVLVQQLTGVGVKVAPEVPMAFPLGSKVVVTAPLKKMEETQRENRARQFESASV